jgi:hypothetical protein
MRSGRHGGPAEERSWSHWGDPTITTVGWEPPPNPLSDCSPAPGSGTPSAAASTRCGRASRLRGESPPEHAIPSTCGSRTSSGSTPASSINPARLTCGVLVLTMFSSPPRSGIEPRSRLVDGCLIASRARASVCRHVRRSPPTVVEPIEPVIGARAFGIPPAAASRDDRSDGAHALLPADFFFEYCPVGCTGRRRGVDGESSRTPRSLHDLSF